MAAYYNEIEPYAAQWLRNLIAAGHIAPGDVDERDIRDVRPDDLRAYTQCHFFAGIGVWSYALRIAGWPDDRPVWTGSAPCQPFSEAGKGLGFSDPRHLWPEFARLIKKCCPATVFGEQVAKKPVDVWLDLVQDDLEGMDYAFGAIPFPSASVGSPQNRDRIYWVANSDDTKRWAEESGRDFSDRAPAERDKSNRDAWERLHGPNWKTFAASFCIDADGYKTRLAKLRAIGNTINAEQAAEFIAASRDSIDA